MSDCSGCQYATLRGCDWTSNVNVFSTLSGSLLPRSFVNLVPSHALPKTRLDAGTSHREAPCCMKLHRVPRPTRAHQLLVSPRDEHKVTLCILGSDKQTEVKTGSTSNGARTSGTQRDHDLLPTSATREMVVPEVGYQFNVQATVVSTSPDHRNMICAAFGSRQGRTRTSIETSDQRHLDVGGRSVQTPDGDHLQQSASHRHRSRYTRAQVPRRSGGGAEVLDVKYRERRRKNNEAAKRSRDIRRANERQVTLRAELLERENVRLRAELGALTEDTLRLYCLLVTHAYRCAQCRR